MTRDSTADGLWWDRVFQPDPETWGLRGDPFAWHELRLTLRGQARPADESSMQAMIIDALEELVGKSLDAGEESVTVARFEHGGMSSGQVDLHTWRTRLIPLLVGRGGLPG